MRQPPPRIPDKPVTAAIIDAAVSNAAHDAEATVVAPASVHGERRPLTPADLADGQPPDAQWSPRACDFILPRRPLPSPSTASALFFFSPPHRGTMSPSTPARATTSRVTTGRSVRDPAGSWRLPAAIAAVTAAAAIAAVMMMVAPTAVISVVAAATAGVSAAGAAAAAATSTFAYAVVLRVAAVAVCSAMLLEAVATTRAAGCALLAAVRWAACLPRLVVTWLIRSRAAIVALIMRGIQGEHLGVQVFVVALWLPLRAALLAFLLVDVLYLVHLIFKEVGLAPRSPDSSRSSMLVRGHRGVAAAAAAATTAAAIVKVVWCDLAAAATAVRWVAATVLWLAGGRAVTPRAVARR
ncbi:hypothetical protein BU14_0332s0013 [Porphyra umbilicalis]|uniref:Uncharacterized protein n=1 Tax=Porphyra umbilicalis TaxID=2786 RepID=A0A1X6NYG0_PORUM|nr:hypothetical protein BU14_0332s0013 [Porphyra umbilicalis]|eukprot:OSX73661.1 hypothetical protein BU14_0332s0013 [Porphyra umbilicalis]